MSVGRNVFVSHRHGDDHLVVDLLAMLRRRGLVIRDASVLASDPNPGRSRAELEASLRLKIRWAGTVFVIVTPATKDHSWVDWEVREATRYPTKRVIGIWAPGSQRHTRPSSLNEMGVSVVGWDADEILQALGAPWRRRRGPSLGKV